jgi:peroxiredoxin
VKELNLSIRGKETTVSSACNKITVTKGNLEVWFSGVEKGQLSCFPSLDTFFSDRKLKMA